MTLRICHISDTHGHFPELYGSYDIIVHSGDFCPNFTNISRDLDGDHQLNWLKSQMPNLKKWLGNYTFLFTLGNHDFLNPFVMEKELRKHKINAKCLHDQVVDCNDFSFYGFPYVPYINGSFNYERTHPEMQKEIDKMVNVINSTHVDVLVCHAPPYQSLDKAKDFQNYGNLAMAQALDYKIDENKMPTHYLSGHIHESRGIKMRNSVLISNAAVFQQIIEI
ncbi:MAG TPA: metallophosphoesterase [Gammaproteobacteria bacterium]|jgi:Icc-related predicted phosphoesterase|nr:metallophosphoesterase [Gammaproteobacteria bacterium]